MARDRAWLFTVVALSFGLNATAVWWGLPSRFAWAPDELQPPVILKGIEERFSGDWHQPAYPPLHYYVLAAAYLPVLAFDTVDVDSVTGRTLLYYLGRGISLAMGIGIVLVVYQIGLRLFGARAALFGALTATFTTPFVYYAKTANLDVPVTFWVLLSLYFFLRHLDTGRDAFLALFTGTGVLAMGTKDQAYAFYVLPAVFYLWHRYRQRRVVFDRPLLVIGGGGLVLFLAIHNVWFNFDGFVHHFEEILWARRHYSAFEADASSQLALFGQSVRHFVFALGPPLALAAVAGVGLALAARRNNPLPLWLLAAGFSYYLFFVAPVRSTWLRYSVPLALLIAPFAGYGLAGLWETGKLWYRASIVAALVYSFLYAASVDVLLLNDARYDVERWLRDHVGPGEIVGFMGPEYYLPRLDGFESRRLRPVRSVLERARPEYLVINPDYFRRFAPGSREGELISLLRAGRTPYGLVLRHRKQPKWMLLRFEGILANLAKVNPVIEVYERSD